ncbi:MAG: exodeoxyribonuclease VII small subunit [Cyclobacteriaceae bacterium]|nr:exodeoxyribonuclease VII small subunit [Cyclobacteriaceae bacterium]
MARKTLTYTQALRNLEKIVNKIEHEEPDVDELNDLVKQASSLIKYCNIKLKATEEELNKNLGDM